MKAHSNTRPVGARIAAGLPYHSTAFFTPTVAYPPPIRSSTSSASALPQLIEILVVLSLITSLDSIWFVPKIKPHDTWTKAVLCNRRSHRFVGSRFLFVYYQNLAL